MIKFNLNLMKNTRWLNWYIEHSHASIYGIYVLAYLLWLASKHVRHFNNPDKRLPAKCRKQCIGIQVKPLSKKKKKKKKIK